MLSALARSALRASAPVQTASRTTFTLPILSSRAYSAISEALEHPDASSAAPTTKRTRSSPTKTTTTKTTAKKPVSAKAKEKAALAKQKQKEKEKEKAHTLKEKTKAKELKAKEAAKAKADKVKEKQKAKAEKEKATVAVDKPLIDAVEELLAVPATLPLSPLAVFMGERFKEADQPTFQDVHEEWKEATQATKDKIARLAAENKEANNAAVAAFIESHKPIEIYKHNRAVRRIKALKEEGVTNTKIGRILTPRGLQLKLLEDPRAPKRSPPSALNLFMSESLVGSPSGSGEQQSKFKTRIAQWNALSESEKAEWKEKAAKQRKEVWEPAMMEMYGTIHPSVIRD